METFEGQIKIFESKIPNTVKVGEAVYYSEPLLEYAPESKACSAYEDLAKELVGYDVRRHIVGGANRTLISVKLPLRLCRTGTCRRLFAG